MLSSVVDAGDGWFAADWSGPPRRVVQQALERLLPLDRQRTREAEVWLLLAARTQVDPYAPRQPPAVATLVHK